VRITAVEVAAALFRRVRAGNLPLSTAQAALALLRNDLVVTFRVIEVTSPLVEGAVVTAERRALRGYDCVQLAGALAAHRARFGVVLVTADGELKAAAKAEGLQVEDPNEH